MKTLLSVLITLSVLGRLPAQTVSCQLICNGDFEMTNVMSVSLVSVVPCWSTTASDGLMEVWASGFNGVPSASSGHHMELNATQAATMYQDFPVTFGQVITISFAHRGRAGVDSMQVSLGPTTGPFTTLGKYGDGTSAWGFYSVTYTATATTTLRLRFTPIYWSGGNVAIGNFLDAVSVASSGSLTVSASSPTMCAGNTVTLTASGAVGYTWSTTSTLTAIVSGNTCCYHILFCGCRQRFVLCGCGNHYNCASTTESYCHRHSGILRGYASHAHCFRRKLLHMESGAGNGQRSDFNASCQYYILDHRNGYRGLSR
jgi:hypothetical protein